MRRNEGERGLDDGDYNEYVDNFDDVDDDNGEVDQHI